MEPFHRQLWEELSPQLWQATHNPGSILQTVARERLESKLKDPGFREKMNGLLSKKREAALSGSLCSTRPCPSTSVG